MTITLEAAINREGEGYYSVSIKVSGVPDAKTASDMRDMMGRVTSEMLESMGATYEGTESMH